MSVTSDPLVQKGDGSMPGDVLILALRRGGEFILPRRNTRLELDDHVTLAGSIDHLNAAQGGSGEWTSLGDKRRG
jgi:Trk K+ transport system NAD-binding subunit